MFLDCISWQTPCQRYIFCLVLLVVEQGVEAWVMSISVTLPDFMQLKSGIFLMIPTMDDRWWVRNKLVDQFQSRDDVTTYSASPAQCLKMTCSTRLSAYCGWQNPRQDRHKIFESKVRLQTADCMGSAGGRNLQYSEPTWPSSCSFISCCLPTPNLPVWPAVLHELFCDNYVWLNSHFVLKCLGEKFLVGRGRSLSLLHVVFFKTPYWLFIEAASWWAILTCFI